VGIVTSSPADVHTIENLVRETDGISADEKLETKDGSQINVSSTIIISGPELITLNQHQWNQLCAYDEIIFA